MMYLKLLSIGTMGVGGGARGGSNQYVNKAGGAAAWAAHLPFLHHLVNLLEVDDALEHSRQLALGAFGFFWSPR